MAGQDFDASKLRADFVKRIPQVGFDRIMLQFKINREVRDVNGWNYTLKTGVYGTDYLMRALVTAIGLGANRPRDAVYPTSLKDASDSAYDGARLGVWCGHRRTPAMTEFETEALALLRSIDETLKSLRKAAQKSEEDRKQKELQARDLTDFLRGRLP